MSVLSANKNVFARFEILDLATAMRWQYTANRNHPFIDYREQIEVIDNFMLTAEKSGRALHVFKLAPYQMLSLPNIMHHLIQNDFAVVKLYRENLVKAAVSQIAARQLRAKTGLSNARDDVQGLGRIRVERNVFFSSIASMVREIDHLHMAAAYAPKSDIVTCTYESMLTDMPAILRSISELTGVPVKLATPKTRKNLKYQLADSVENFDELRSWLAGTYLEQFL